MEMKEERWNGFRMLSFLFEGKKAVLVCPETPTEDKKWLFKTEYFLAFQDFELLMVKRGYYLANIENDSRWGLPEVTARQARFAAFLQEEFGLHNKCMTVGMSCGGMQSVYLAARYPGTVACMFLDAPVMNLLSCPFGLGRFPRDYFGECARDYGWSVSQFLGYREHPMDMLPILKEQNLPVFLSCGTADEDVPYEENGKYLTDYYRENGLPLELALHEGRGHHPHGLPDYAPLIAFAERYYG